MKQCVLIQKKKIAAALLDKPIQGKRQLEPLKSLFLAKKIPFTIIEDCNVNKTEAEVHKQEGDLICCLEGKITFVYGGKLVDPWTRDGSDGNELGGHDIRNGTSVILKPGDWLWIPPHQPHLHKTSGVARMILAKIRA